MKTFEYIDTYNEKYQNLQNKVNVMDKKQYDEYYDFIKSLYRSSVKYYRFKTKKHLIPKEGYDSKVIDTGSSMTVPQMIRNIETIDTRIKDDFSYLKSTNTKYEINLGTIYDTIDSIQELYDKRKDWLGLEWKLDDVEKTQLVIENLRVPSGTEELRFTAAEYADPEYIITMTGFYEMEEFIRLVSSIGEEIRDKDLKLLLTADPSITTTVDIEGALAYEIDTDNNEVVVDLSHLGSPGEYQIQVMIVSGNENYLDSLPEIFTYTK